MHGCCRLNAVSFARFLSDSFDTPPQDVSLAGELRSRAGAELSQLEDDLARCALFLSHLLCLCLEHVVCLARVAAHPRVTTCALSTLPSRFLADFQTIF